MNSLLLLALLFALPLRAVGLTCAPFLPLRFDQIPSGFTTGTWELLPNPVAGEEGTYHCKETALVQLHANGPVYAVPNSNFRCIDGKWVSAGLSEPPRALSCVVPPADFNKECVMTFVFPDVMRSDEIIPLLPAFKYCPNNWPSILEDGTRFESISCAATEIVDDDVQYNYDVKLVNGTIIRRIEDWYITIGCEATYTCPTIPEIPTNLIPSGFVVAEFNRSQLRPSYSCHSRNALVQFDAEGPIIAMTIPYFHCINSTWIVDDSSRVPVRMTCATPLNEYKDCSVQYIIPEGAARIVPLLPDFKYCPANRPSILEDGTPFTSIVCAGSETIGDGRQYNFDVKLTNGTIVRRTNVFNHTWDTWFNGLRVSCGDIPTTTTTTVATTTTTANPNCPPDGVWGEWTEIGTCSATCGACANTTRKRVCTTECGNCPCKGLSEDVGPCASALCPFPSSVTCCKPYVKSLNQRTRNFFCGTGEYPAPVCSSTTSTSTTSTTTVATTTTIKKDAYATAAQLWNVNFYYNYGVGVHAFCADQTCINAIQSNGIGYDMYNGWGLLGRAVSESAIGAVRAACPTGSQNLRNLGFTKSGNKYLHNLSGSGLKQGWVAIASGSCGATVQIKRWKSRYTDDMMYGVDLEWNTWYQGMVQDGGLPQFYMWN